MTFTKEQTKMLKKVELELLKVFIAICKQENLQYFVVGGTALGTVRHKGFIPWDDDIDVAMPRKDYEKFIKIAQARMPEYLFLQNIDTEKNYLQGFSKIRDSRTTFIEISCKNFKINHGVYLDIFPLDGYPSSKLKSYILDFLKKIYNSRISLEFSLDDSSCVCKKILKNFLKLFYPVCRKVIEKREKLFKKYDFDSCDYIANHCGAWGKKEIMPKEIFGKGTIGSFDGIQVILPEKYDEYLTRMYGDYMELPPIEKRIAHHYCDVIDFEKSYLEYTKDENI